MRITLSHAFPARWRALITPAIGVLIGVMAPSLMVGMDHHTFGVALPTIRAYWGLDADTAAWTSMTYSLPFMALMPLYGRLGDSLGKRRLLLLGTLLFLVGTCMVAVSSSLGWFLLGRLIQGIGTAGFVPLSIAIITQSFAAHERGKIMGIWNSIIPLTGLIFPYFGGLLVEQLGWRAIYPPTLVAGVVALLLMLRYVPAQHQRGVDWGFLRAFDWLGVLLLSSAMIALLFFTSSRPLTGVDGLADWRLLGICLCCFAGLLLWERRRGQPYINFQIFQNRNFTAVSVGAGLRMFLMSCTSFVLPLYLTDIHQLTASIIGVAVALQAGMLFVTSLIGGQVADRWGGRRPVLISMVGLVAVMIALALAPAGAPVWLILALTGVHGLIIGLSLAPLHRASMQGIAPQETGAAAGLYSMIRFAGQILGVAVAGVTLQKNLALNLAPINAYQAVFWLYAVVAVAATVIGWGMSDE